VSADRPKLADGLPDGGALPSRRYDRNLKTAQAAAYAAVEKIHFEGAHFRRDIAAKALK
jgi:phosphoribosylamine-glycine ligase